MKVTVIKRHVTDTLNAPPPYFVAVACDVDAAKKWIQDEVDGKHRESGMRYAQGQTADWWIEFGTFSLTDVDVEGTEPAKDDETLCD